MSAEYGTGTIRATLSAVPRRPVVLSAKILVFGAVAVVVSEILTFTAFAVGQAILSAKHAVGSSAAITQRAQQLGVKIPHDLQALALERLRIVGAGRRPAGRGRCRSLSGRARAAGPGTGHHHPAHRRRHLGLRRDRAGPAPHRPGVAHRRSAMPWPATCPPTSAWSCSPPMVCPIALGPPSARGQASPCSCCTPW